MATINERILLAALEDGIITDEKLTGNQLIYISSAVCSVNEIYHLLKEKKELELEEIVRLTNLNKNTLAQYLRFLQKHKIIRILAFEVEDKDGKVSRNLYRLF